MANAPFDWREPFEGSLLSLLHRLREDVPSIEHLVAAQRWVLAQLDARENLLPLRTFAGHRDRGVPFPEGRALRFMPVDNEPLVELIAQLLSGRRPWSAAAGSKERTFAELFGGRDLTVSWSAPRADAGYRRGAAKAAFRERGILLAHIFDAARAIDGADDATCRTRYVRSMNPINVAPWPGHRRTVQSIVRAPEDFTRELRGCRDLSSEKPVQEILAGWMASLLGGIDAEASALWLHTAGAVVTPRMREWERIAREVDVAIVPRSAAAAPRAAPARPVRANGGDAFPGGAFASLDELTDALEGWLASFGPDGHAPKTIGAAATVELDFFPGERARLPVGDRHGHVLSNEDVDLAALNGRFTLADDSWSDAARMLVQRHREVREDEWTLFDPGLTKTKYSLKFAGSEETPGLYLYRPRR